MAVALEFLNPVIPIKNIVQPYDAASGRGAPVN
jgi:hypothetical protein